MAFLTRTAALVVASLCLAACSEPTRPAGANAPSQNAALSADRAAATGLTARFVSMMDACDPATFNAVLGPGSCTRQGGVKFDKFIAQLQRHQMAGAWHFAPSTVQARLGQTIIATNRGGEEHTFTRVAAFGGGIVPSLNQLSGNPTVAPECTQLDEDDFVEPGGTYSEDVDAGGMLLFQCCIHPWMRAEVHVMSH
jgi:plastocyanin